MSRVLSRFEWEKVAAMFDYCLDEILSLRDELVTNIDHKNILTPDEKQEVTKIVDAMQNLINNLNNRALHQIGFPEVFEIDR